MWSVLAKHGSVERPKAVEPPKAESSSLLKWKRVSEWAMESQCGFYRISKAMVKGIPHYQAYRLTPQREWWFCLAGDCPSFDAAKAIVERSRA